MLQTKRLTNTPVHPMYFRGVVSLLPLHDKIWLSCFKPCPPGQPIREAMGGIGREISFSLGFGIVEKGQKDLAWQGLPLSYFLEQGPIFAIVTSLVSGLRQSPPPMIHFERKEAVGQIARIIAASHQPSPYLVFVADTTGTEKTMRVDASVFHASAVVGASHRVQQRVREIFLV